MNIKRRDMLFILRVSRPHFLLGAALVYGLGAAIASYLGRNIQPGIYMVGQALITLIQLMAHFLNEHFEGGAERNHQNHASESGNENRLNSQKPARHMALYAAIICAALTGVLASVFLIRGIIPLLAWIILLLIFLGAFFYNAPPVRLATSGYGEVTTSVLVGALLPIFAFALQTGELHRLLLMSSTPLVAILFAMMITFQLRDYASDMKSGHQTLTVRLGWATAMRLHDIAILFAILSLLLAFLTGLPRRVAIGSIIALPLALAQIWQMGRIRGGSPVRWRTLTLSAIGLFGLITYLELIGYLFS